MSQNVYEQLAQTKKPLADKMGENAELGNVILGFLGRIIMMAIERGKPIEGVTTAPLLASRLGNGDLVIRSKVVFYPLPIHPPALWRLQSDFARYTQGKAHGLAQALQKNAKLAGFFQEVVECIESWANERGMQFGAIRVKQSIISNPGDVFVLKVGKNVNDE